VLEGLILEYHLVHLNPNYIFWIIYLK
jgi:hypothetical protein